jgi:hypothetical protein
MRLWHRRLLLTAMRHLSGEDLTRVSRPLSRTAATVRPLTSLPNQIAEESP